VPRIEVVNSDSWVRQKILLRSRKMAGRKWGVARWNLAHLQKYPAIDAWYRAGHHCVSSNDCACWSQVVTECLVFPYLVSAPFGRIGVEMSRLFMRTLCTFEVVLTVLRMLEVELYSLMHFSVSYLP
jgi:hypothetical protein